MAPKCKICFHEKREAIDKALVSGTPIRIIADQFHVSLGSLNRHKEAHIPLALKKAHDASEMEQNTDLLSVTMRLLQESQDITTEARRAGDLKTALMGIGKTSDLISLLTRVATEMKSIQQEKANHIPPEKGENTVWLDMSKVRGLTDDELLILDKAVKSLAP